MKKIVSLLGISGSGKSTQIEMLKEHYGEDVLIASVPGMIKNKNNFHSFLTEGEKVLIKSLQKEIDCTRELGMLSPIDLDILLFDVCLNRADQNIVIFDGCPRGNAQTILLWNKMTKSQKENYYVFILAFPDHQEEYSFYRQYFRGIEEHGVVDTYSKIQRFINKISVYNKDTLLGINFLENKTKKCITINSLSDKKKINNDIISKIDDN